MILTADTEVGPYRIIGTLGSGGMGIVYRAEDERLGRPVAIKFISGPALLDPHANQRFQREARAASSLNHPNICTIYDVGEHAGAPFLVMELLEGQTLASRLATGPLPLQEAIHLTAAIADALDTAHQRGIVHRDIKPANVFITSRGEPKLLDFGLARLSGSAAAADATAAHTGTTAGTVAYMSPEQARDEPLDVRSDLFSLGATLYEAVSGRLPFPGASTALVFDAILNKPARPPSQLNSQVSPALEPIILRALEKDRNLRYQTAADLRADLNRLVRADSSGPVPAATPRRQRLPLLIAAAATIVVGGLGYVLWRGQPDSNNRSVSLEQITESGDVVTAAISDDGKYVAYAEAVSDGIALNVRQVQTKAAVTIIPAGTHRYAGLAFSRDGQYLYVTTSAPSSLIRIPTLGGASTKLLDEITTSVSVSPDDRQLAFVRSKNNDAELVVASADGTSLRALAVQKRLPYGTPAWSPDGQSIAWPQGPLVTDATVTITSADGTRKEDLALAGWKYVDSVLWLPDGRGFVVTAEERTRELTGRHQVLEVSYPGLAIKRLTNDLGDYHSLTGDPKTALAAVPLAVRSGISVGPLAKPDGLRRVGTGSTDGVRGLTWAPDRRIVFTDVYSVGWIMNPDGSGLRPLLPDRQSAGFPFSCGSAVGYTQAGVAPALMVFLIDSNDGKPRHVIDIPYVRPTCTPDGAWLLYEDNETIKKVQTSGGEPATVHKDAHDPQVSPDGVFLAALTGPAGAPSFVIFSMKDNSMVRRLPGRAGANYRWDADSQALILSRGEGNVDNLWRLPIDGSPAVQLTQFTSDRIFTFSVGADRRLAVARGETAHDVVILRR